MNRRVRNRSHGGVGGGSREAPSYPIAPGMGIDLEVEVLS
jgi:hypothetical protein